MKPIIEYQDYHLFIRDYYDDRKRRSYFSWREFAKLAGFASSTYLRLVSEGKSNLSRVTMDRMVGAMELVGYEVPYFKAMVNFCNAKNETAKAEFSLASSDVTVFARSLAATNFNSSEFLPAGFAAVS